MSETNPGDLPLATAPGTPQIDPPPQPSTSLPELADVIAAGEDAVQMRVGIITAVEVTGSRRVKVDIGNTTWLNRLQDTQLAVGDRVSVLQSGAIMLVIGRLTGTDAFTPVGGILEFGGSSAPTNFLLCDGSAISRTTYAGLFAVIGTTYGVGNGTTTFNIPDFRNRLPMGAGTSFALGTTGGSATMTLTTTHLPSHSHSFADTSDSQGSHSHSLSGSTTSDSHSHSVGNQNSRSDILAGGGTTTASTGSGSTGSDAHSHTLSGTAASAGGHTHSISGTTGSAGSGGSFSTTGPYTAVNYIIRAL